MVNGPATIARRDETYGVPVATDRISGRDIQQVKIILGANGVNDGPLSSANTLPVSTPVVTTATSSSATVTNSSGVKVAALTTRIGGFIQNLSTTEVLFYAFGPTATTSDFKLGPYQILPFHIDGCLYQGAISMIADDAGPYNIKIVECV